MGKALLITEKKSVADDFARVLGSGDSGTASGRVFMKYDLSYESEDLVIAWASGHLMALQEPGAYDKAWKFWSLAKLPIIPEKFKHTPREGDKKSSKLLRNLVKLIRREDVDRLINGCDAGREGELIFNLILDHARRGTGKTKADKPVERLWLQSMTTASIVDSWKNLKPSDEYVPLRNAAYSRDKADWLVGMNGTRALTKRFLGGKNRNSLAVGRVKTPTLAFLVDRERLIDAFIPDPYWEIGATFDTGSAGGNYEASWFVKEDGGKAQDRIFDQKRAEEIVKKVDGKTGTATDTTKRSKEKPPQLFDLTTLQRRASSLFGFTLRRTLSITQSLYEKKKAVTYPRTGSRYLPNDYLQEVPGILKNLAGAGYAREVALIPQPDAPQPERKGAVYDDSKVGDHFAIIPTGQIPKSFREDEKKLYDLIVRRFIAAFLPSAERQTITRITEVEGETFKVNARKLLVPGWRAVEPSAKDDPSFPPLAEDGAVTCSETDLIEKETTPPNRFSDGSLVAEMETCGKHVEDEAEAEALKEIGIGTPATRASIVEDLIYKRLARRDGRTLIPTALGSTLVRAVRNLDLDMLAKPDLTGQWEQRLRSVTEGKYAPEKFVGEIVGMVEHMVEAVKGAESGSAVFALDHPKGLKCPKCSKPIIEKAYSYFCSDEEGCGVLINKDVGGKHVFPEVLGRLIEAKGEPVGPFTGIERPKAPCKLRLRTDDGLIVLEPQGDVEWEEPGSLLVEKVPDGKVMGKCPKCETEVKSEPIAYKCTKDNCTFRLSKRLLNRELPPDDVEKILSGGETKLIDQFISRRGRPFSAYLHFDEAGSLKWRFPERKKKASKKKKSKKKKSKKKASKKKASKKKSSKKKASKEQA